MLLLDHGIALKMLESCWKDLGDSARTKYQIFACTNFNDHQFGILDPVSQKSKATNLIDLLHGLTKKQSPGF